MNRPSLKTLTEKLANFLIIALVVVGTAAFGAATNAGDEGVLLSKAFLIFLGAIITLQVLPALVLLGAMVKGIVSIGKKERQTDTSRDSGH